MMFRISILKTSQDQTGVGTTALKFFHLPSEMILEAWLQPAPWTGLGSFPGSWFLPSAHTFLQLATHTLSQAAHAG